jgi:hypothetical protein
MIYAILIPIGIIVGIVGYFIITAQTDPDTPLIAEMFEDEPRRHG